MALQAQSIHVAHLEHARIRRPMRRVAGDTAPGLYHRVLVRIRSSRIRMTFRADRVLIVGGPQLLRLEGAVRIVAIGAAHQPLVHLVVKRLREGRTHILVAGVAQNGLIHFQQVGLACGLVNAMATQAAYTCFGVL